MHGLDPGALKLLAAERSELLRRDMERSRRAGRGTRVRVGLWLVGVGFRVAGPCAPRARELAA